MAQTYSIEFKEEACKRVQSGVPAAQSQGNWELM